FDGSRGSGYDIIPADAATNYDNYKDASGVYHSGSSSKYKSQLENRLFEGFFSYSKDIKSIKSHFDAIAGYSIQDFNNTSFSNFYVNNVLYYNTLFSDGSLDPRSSSNYPYYINENILTSFYGRVNYNYAQKYYLAGSIRSDESTKIAPATRTGTFPSVSAAWRISNEDFLKGSSLISNLKLRLEYGVTGNQEGVEDYAYLAQYSLSNANAQYAFGNQYYLLYRPGPFYPGRTWETSAMTNNGLDYGFLNDRITGSIDYYYNKTRNLLETEGQSAGSNFGNTIVGNIGNMENDGLEFSVNGRLIDNKRITWTALFNVS